MNLLATMALSGADYAAIAGMLALFVGMPLTLVLHAIRGVTKRVDAVEQRGHERIGNVEEEVREVDRTKIDKKDFIREAFSTRQKVEAVSQQLATLAGKLEGEFGIGAAINTLADRIGSLVGSKDHG